MANVLRRHLQHLFKNNFCDTFTRRVSISNVCANRPCSASAIEKVNDERDNTADKRSTVAKLKELFNIRTFAALDIATRHKKLCMSPDELISENYKLCSKKGIENKTMLKYPEILAQKKLPEKVSLIEKLPHDLNVTAPLLQLDLPKLYIFVQRYKKELDETKKCRIKIFSDCFDLTKEETCNALYRRPFLCSIDIERVQNTVKMLEDFGINKEAICKDLWVLRYNPDVISHRLGIAKENKIESPKTWMVRAKPEIFERYVNRRSEQKSILGNNSLAQYLSNRLKCSVDEAIVLMMKHPALKHKSLKKMEEIIDFLYSEGFTPHHIYKVPKILLHSVETTRKRLKQIENLGMKLDSLNVLTKSQKQYAQAYESLLKSSKKSNS